MTVRPLQVSSRPRCCVRVPNTWWHKKEFGEDSTDHQCPFPRGADGFCRRHSPKQRRAMLERRERRIVAALEKCRAELAQLPPDLSNVLNPS